jgi:uncharacterized membrane protein YeiH
MVGAIAFTVLCHAGVPLQAATPIGVVIVLGLRLAGIRWRLSLPEFETTGARERT